MEYRGVFICDNLERADAHPFANIVVGHFLRAVGECSCDLVGIDSLFLEPMLVKYNHINEIATSGVAGYEYLSWVTAS